MLRFTATRVGALTLAMGLLGAISAAPAYSATPPATSAKQGYRQACTARSGNYFHCLTLIAPRHANGKSPQAAAAKPDGLGVQDLRKAYQLPQNPPAGATVAIAIAFHSPTLESDLNTYRKQYGLSACTVANRCLTVLNQNGDATPVPENDPGWEVEETLDVSMVSASCPSCRIVVVEATDDSFNNLAAATVMAGQHATVVSNSYGGPKMALPNNSPALTTNPITKWWSPPETMDSPRRRFLRRSPVSSRWVARSSQKPTTLVDSPSPPGRTAAVAAPPTSRNRHGNMIRTAQCVRWLMFPRSPTTSACSTPETEAGSTLPARASLLRSSPGCTGKSTTTQQSTLFTSTRSHSTTSPPALTTTQELALTVGMTICARHSPATTHPPASAAPSGWPHSKRTMG